jgi:hypothetical protein
MTARRENASGGLREPEGEVSGEITVGQPSNPVGAEKATHAFDLNPVV